MIKNIKLVVMVVLLSTCWQGVASAQTQMKIGAIRLGNILEQSPQAAQAKKRLTKEFAGREKELLAQQKELKALEEKLAKDAAILSAQERSKLERDVVTQRREAKRAQDQFREDVNFRHNEELTKVQQEVVKAVNVVAKEHGYDAVFSEGIIYASPEMDISELVIEKLNKGTK